VPLDRAIGAFAGDSYSGFRLDRPLCPFIVADESTGFLRGHRGADRSIAWCQIEPHSMYSDPLPQCCPCSSPFFAFRDRSSFPAAVATMRSAAISGNESSKRPGVGWGWGRKFSAAINPDLPSLSRGGFQKLTGIMLLQWDVRRTPSAMIEQRTIFRRAWSPTLRNADQFTGIHSQGACELT
jgi:hypothetical protein